MKCDNCGKYDFKVVKGWESKKALKCPDKKCGQYYYYVGKILCSYTLTDAKIIQVEAIKKELGLE